MHRQLLLPVLLALGISCGGTESPKEHTPSTALAPANTSDAAPAMPKANETPAPVPTTTLKLGESVPLSGATGPVAKLVDMTTEVIEASPVDPENYPGGSGVTLVVEMAGRTYHFSELSQGYNSQKVAWSPEFRLTLVAVDTSAGAADFQIERITKTVVKTLHEGKRLDRNAGLALEGDVQAVFAHHGHKRTYPGQRSPLMVSMSYTHGDQELASETNNLFPPEDASWTWRNYRFELGEYSYGEFMNLTVRVLALEPVASAAQSE